MKTAFRSCRLLGLLGILLISNGMGGCGSDEPTETDTANGDVQITDGSDGDTDTQEDDATLADGSNIEPDVSDVGPDIAGTDGQSDDAGPGDVLDDIVQLPCGQLCGVDEICLEGVCVRQCSDGLSVEELVAELSPGAQVVANFCSDTSAIQAYRVLPTYEVLEVRAASSGSSTDLALVKWPLYLAEGPSAGETLSTQSVPGTIDTWEVLPAPFVAASAGAALWGYATATDVLGGAVLKIELAQPYSSELQAASGLAGGELLSDDDMLTYSFQLGSTEEGPGIYYRRSSQDKNARVVNDLGQSTGDIVRVGDYLLISSYSDNWTPCDGTDQDLGAGKRVYVVPTSDVTSAFDNGTSVSARCDASRLDISADFVGLGDGYILTREMNDAFEYTGLKLHQLSVESAVGTAQLSDSMPVTEGAAFIGGRKMEGADVMLLQHEAGFLMIKADYLASDPSTD